VISPGVHEHVRSSANAVIETERSRLHGPPTRHSSGSLSIPGAAAPAAGGRGRVTCDGSDRAGNAEWLQKVYGESLKL